MADSVLEMPLMLTGFGNVGQGVARLIADSGEKYVRSYGIKLLLTAVSDRGGVAMDPGGLDPIKLLKAKSRHGTVAGYFPGSQSVSIEAAFEHCGAQVLLEAASTNFRDAEPGWSYVRGAFNKGMDVVFASKGSLVLFYRELLDEARRQERQVRFSATVGAPLPVLDIADRSLAGLSITGFEGLVNATANQILAVMSTGASYEEGVREAQRIGIAETDPTLDVEGWDAAAKVVILSNTILGADLKLEAVDRNGIMEVTTERLHEAKQRGQTLKLIGRGSSTPDGVKGWVGVEERAANDLLAGLRGHQLGIILFAETVGSISCSVGEGGGVPTASAMLRDVLNLARDRMSHPPRA